MDKDNRLIFQSDLCGLRAMRKVLRAYYFKHHLVTIRQITLRWAKKPVDKKKLAEFNGYCLGVAQKSGVDLDTRLWLEDDVMMETVAKAIIYGENGSQPYPESLLKKVFIPSRR